MMSAMDALAFIEQRGAVLVAAKGPVPRLIEVILGEPIQGSWWGHARGHAIYAVLQQLQDCPELLTCRLIGDKVTLLHRRLWPALVRLQGRFRREQLAQIRQEHTPSGKHINRVVHFPSWVPPEVEAAAQRLSERQAEQILAAALTKDPLRDPLPHATRT